MNKDNNSQNSDNCCGEPALKNIKSCCIAEADAKPAGNAGCGCSTETLSNSIIVKITCCG